MTDPNLTRITAAILRGRAGGRPVVLRCGDLRGARTPGHRTRPQLDRLGTHGQGIYLCRRPRGRCRIFSQVPELAQSVRSRCHFPLQGGGKFGIPCPRFPTLRTCQTARRAWPELPNHKLSTLAGHIGHTSRHHNALDDAEAAGRVLAVIIKERGEAWVVG